jgi:hypothetical protein
LLSSNPIVTCGKFEKKYKDPRNMLVEIFSAPIASGAQLFWLIVCILIGLGAGISAIDFRSTVFKKTEKEE